MKQELEAKIVVAVQDLFAVEAVVELSRPEEQFGDYATNVALQLSKQVGKNPKEIGEALAEKLRTDLSDQVSEVTVAGPGFLNLKLSDQALVNSLSTEPNRSLAGQTILVEFGDPNPFKAMHIGHLYSYVVGDSICYLLEAAGAKVKRLSYHGDVGLHVAKAIWGMQQADYGSKPATDPVRNNIGLYYANGAQAYEADPKAKEEIDAINQQVYAFDPVIRVMYEEGKERSFANFDQTLQEMEIKNSGHDNDGRYLESQSAPEGLATVKSNLGTVFTESEGAVVYEGEKVGLHTRVFITSKGLPTYETKDLGLTELKKRDFPEAARSIIITANEQAEYFKVMLAALSEIDSELAAKTQHITHGFVSLSSGKMSSRTGDIYSAISLIQDVDDAIKKLDRGEGDAVKVGAIKYAFTKHRIGGDLVYDVSESVSLEGNSGPYLQYAQARARSILAKASQPVIPSEAEESRVGSLHFGRDDSSLQPDERSLLRKIGEYAEVIDRATAELMPHHICSYLYELAQVFNRFYEHNRVINNERQAVRLALVEQYANRLKQGLELLGITAPDKL